MNKKTKIMISFQENGQNGGPYHSHKRIMESDLKEKYEFIPLIVPRFRKLIKPKNFKQLVREIKQSEAKIVHFHGLQLEGFMTLVAIKIAGNKKTVCAIRGSSRDAMNISRISKIIFCKLEHWTLKQTDICYGVSEYVSNWDFVKKYAKNLFGYIYNFQDAISNTPMYSQAEIASIRDELGIEKNSLVIISTGRITFDKGYGTLKDVICKFDTNKKIKFLVVGNGSYLEEMKTTISNFGISEYVIFTGFRKDIGALLDASDVFVTCTKHETFGNSILEAANHCLPVVASNVGGVPEIVVDGKTGYLLESDDVDGFCRALRRLIDDKELRLKMGESAKQFVKEKFNTSTIVNELDSLYQEVLGF